MGEYCGECVINSIYRIIITYDIIWLSAYCLISVYTYRAQGFAYGLLGTYAVDFLAIDSTHLLFMSMHISCRRGCLHHLKCLCTIIFK